MKHSVQLCREQPEEEEGGKKAMGAWNPACVRRTKQIGWPWPD